MRAALESDASEAVVSDLVERAEGNALYLEELIRAVVEGKGGALPETVLAMVQARLEALDMGKRVMHDRAATSLLERCGAIIPDHATARRLPVPPELHATRCLQSSSTPPAGISSGTNSTATAFPFRVMTSGPSMPHSSR